MTGRNIVASAVFGWVVLALFWCALSHHAPEDLIAGALACGLGAWLSLRLWPEPRLRPLAVIRFLRRFLVQSVVAGVATARLAFAREITLKPAILRIPSRCAEGFEKDAFRGVVSLQPGALPVGAESGALFIHCLDEQAPVAAQLAEDERAFLAMSRG